MPVVFVLRKPLCEGAGFFGFEQANMIFGLTSTLIGAGITRIALYTDLHF